MIVAGIDEAGYGPVLGPLVVGCTAFEVDAEGVEDPAIPCLWARLRRLVSRNKLKGGRKLHINDSKLVYSPAGGLREMERAVLAMLATYSEWPPDLASLLALIAGPVVEQLGKYPWYAEPANERFPIEQDAIQVKLIANALRLEMQSKRTRCVHMSARVVCERELNRMFDATRNKGSTLFSISAMHLDELLNRFGGQGLMIVCDRQGGRGYYGPLLRLMFEEWSLEIVSEVEARSEYRLERNGQKVGIVFQEKAEAECLSVALASMVSKYLREAMMRRFNSFWQIQLPGVMPTAGYHGDGTRFLGDIELRRREMGIPDELLIRAR